MSLHLVSPGKSLVLCAALLLVASSAQAQTSPSGHVPARTPYPPRSTAPFSIAPGDHMFQATMKIEHVYQNYERVAPLQRYRAPARPAVAREAVGPVEVAVTEPEGATEMVKIRGPNGEVRSFPIVGGRKAIKARTIIVRPGQSLHLVIQGGNVTVSKK